MFLVTHPFTFGGVSYNRGDQITGEAYSTLLNAPDFAHYRSFFVPSASVEANAPKP